MKLKIKFNTRHNLREKIVHSSITTENDDGVPTEFKSPEREGGDNRIHTELVNSQTFYNNRMADEQFRQLFQALVDKPITNMQPLIFTGVEGEDILTWLNKFEFIVAVSGKLFVEENVSPLKNLIFYLRGRLT